MANVNVNVAGTVKFFSQEKGFGIITTNFGDVFIHVSKCGSKKAELVPDAEVRIDFTSAFKDGKVQHSATALLSVKAPPPPVEVLDVVKFYNEKKGFGFIFCGDAGFTKGQAFLPGHVAKLAQPWEITPGEGMAVRALVVENKGRPEVVSFEWGSEVEAAYAAKLAVLHAEDGAMHETVDSVDELMAAHTAETQAAIGPKPAPKKAAKATLKQAVTKPKAEAKPKMPVTVAEAAEAGLLDNAPEGSMAAQLAALGLKGENPNGATAH